MLLRVEIATKAPGRDVRGEALCAELDALGVGGVQAVQVRDVYWLAGDLKLAPVEALVERLLLDPVVQEVRWDAGQDPRTVEVAFRPGVTDTVAETLVGAARELGVEGLHAATGARYLFDGDIDARGLQRVAEGVLANPVIQRFAVGRVLQPAFGGDAPASDRVDDVPLRDADDDRLLAISGERRLSMDLAEMRAVQAHYVDRGREPTDAELEMLAQTWSEHCVHKTFRALIDYTERRADGSVDDAASGVVDGLLKQYIRGATETLNRPWVRSAFVDNAGIVAFDDALDLAFKVETHNHPSALEPFGGANTGVGGVVRDVIGVSARPIATTDVLCFGPQDLPLDALPDGVLHPRRVAHGVVRGVEDYGNKMGIPTVNGAVYFHPGYIANPLVYVGCLGVLPRNSHPTEPRPGDAIVVVGGATGRDGIRGATFSSMGMDASTGAHSGSAVQIGHPIHEKQALEVVIEARDAGLYHAITDCGAGGLSSAVGEMAETLGADIQLQRIPLKYSGLDPWEIWLSEAQERMVLAVPEIALPRLCAIAQRHGIGATAIGRFRDDGLLRVTLDERVVVELDMQFLHGGLPRRELVAEWQHPTPPERGKPSDDLIASLLSRLGDPNTASKEDIVRRYDHEVQGGTVVKPFVGVAGQGPSDAAVLVPLESHRYGGRRGVALSVGLDPALGLIDPYAMAWAVVDEAFRNLVAVGADPDRVAILDNFCWGDPKLPDRLGALVRCARGCYDAAIAYGAPFVSGKDSLNNEWRDVDGVRRAIPPTLLISAIGIVPDVGRTATSDLKAPGDVLYVVGHVRDEPFPTANPDALVTFRALHAVIHNGLVRACHDCSEGGVLVALAEMAIGGALGADIDLDAIPADATLDGAGRAFAEGSTRFVVAVAPDDCGAFEATLGEVALGRVGVVRGDDRLFVRRHGREAAVTSVNDLRNAWQVSVLGDS